MTPLLATQPVTGWQRTAPPYHLPSQIDMKSIGYQLGYKRQPSRIVKIGDLNLGGECPIRIQSMLSTPTSDVDGCFKEILALDQAGCEMMRLTVPSRKDLSAIPEIRRLMREEGIVRPLIADVHFSPQLAIDACELFEKVRINPGNYSDRPKSAHAKESGAWFEAGYQRLKETIIPLVSNLKKYGRALRIGVNHGSLSSRMIERYGDSPQGMVASALEMIALFEDQGFDQLVVSLKSSNPIVVQKAYRLLLEEQASVEPVALHLGVTEAGNHMMGRIKSLVGIGVLLADGIGDTIRVSLTEPGPNEIAFARSLIASIDKSGVTAGTEKSTWKRPLNHQSPASQQLDLEKVAIGNRSGLKIGTPADSELPACAFEFEPDFLYSSSSGYFKIEGHSEPLRVTSGDQLPEVNPAQKKAGSAILIQSDAPLFHLRKIHSQRKIEVEGLPIGLVVPPEINEKDLWYDIQLAGVLSEGLVDFLLLPEIKSHQALERILSLLQATRVRMIMTDYIVCPSCGRTLFDIERTAAEIKRHTHHLKGLKIGVMGCIVNGPGEMADADFGYVGSGKGKIDLYFGQTRVRRGIAENQAVEKLIELIREKGRWQEPTEDSETAG